MKNPRDVLGRVGVVGAGGGFKGACIPGFLRPLIRRGVQIDYLASVSVSTLMFARLSEARKQSDLASILDHVNSRWDWIEEGGPKVVFPFSAGGLWDGIRHCHFLKNHDPLFRLVENFRPEKSVVSPIQFEFFARDVENKEYTTFSNRDQLFKDSPELMRRAVVASACLWPAFSPIDVGPKKYGDGGFITLDGAVRFGCDTIFVLFPYPETYQAPKPADNLVARILPILEMFSSEMAAALRDLDDTEIRYHEQASELGKKYNLLLSSYERLLQENKGLRQMMSRASEQEKGWFRGLLFKILASVVGNTDTKDVLLERAKCPKFICLNGEPPETLTTKEFKRGDITVMRERAETRMERELDRLLA